MFPVLFRPPHRLLPHQECFRNMACPILLTCSDLIELIIFPSLFVLLLGCIGYEVKCFLFLSILRVSIVDLPSTVCIFWKLTCSALLQLLKHAAALLVESEASSEPAAISSDRHIMAKMQRSYARCNFQVRMLSLLFVVWAILFSPSSSISFLYLCILAIILLMVVKGWRLPRHAGVR